MDFRHDLELALGDVAAQDPLYQPTTFWADASSKIAQSIVQSGVECFRSNPECLGFFVPNYGSPTSGVPSSERVLLLSEFKDRNPECVKGYLALEQMLSGRAAALADLRVLEAADDPLRLPLLYTFTESTYGEPIEQHEVNGRRFSRSSLNYLLGLVMLKRYIARHDLDESVPKTVLEIGGGFGTLGEILQQSGLHDWRYIDVDIPPTATVAEWYLRQVAGDDCVLGYAQTRSSDVLSIADMPEITVLMPWQLPRLTGQIDMFVNFISFQEMEPYVVANYLRLVGNLEPRWVLLRNLKEGKQRRTQTECLGVIEPILGDDYVAMLPCYDLVERGTSPFGYVTVDGFNSELLLFKRKKHNE